MGLAITAYRKLTKIDDPVLEDGEPIDWENEWLAHPDTIEMAEYHWPGRAAGIERGAVYRFAEKVEFRAGSYGGFAGWRRILAQAAGYESLEAVWTNHPDGPFVELLDFSDCEGVIGPIVAAKLAHDFSEHEEKITADADRYFVKKYKLWRKAFEMAADGGAVDFQ